ncbi:hypothetical protein C8J57DRAFT_1534717 [Mycena rebaudengoi]|nr:hypothetical protein C8J57DRAFT_1541442 [Mycena rebaudengoi]KAJ7227944.1 hypothetical protein C8J57DRAFT_1534717 [Mycena rebaudengoi]
MRWPRICPRAELKPPNQTPRTLAHSAFPDVLWTSLLALKESADAFPPLKSTVGGVVALWDIAELASAQRAKHSRTDARDIALRTKDIVDLIADVVPDPSEIPPPMLLSID